MSRRETPPGESRPTSATAKRLAAKIPGKLRPSFRKSKLLDIEGAKDSEMFQLEMPGRAL
uniref:Centromere protein T n=1 Tax=Macrostomum lignano TaxID=282301 RepID=A0A1I8F4W9_9PLAT